MAQDPNLVCATTTIRSFGRQLTVSAATGTERAAVGSVLVVKAEDKAGVVIVHLDRKGAQQLVEFAIETLSGTCASNDNPATGLC